MNNEERKEFLRFNLGKLGAANAHHEFERLAFQLARLRIAPNLQEATGPVSSGGDQGRDFESYKTYLARSIGAGAFVASASGDVIVGACTLNKDTLSKIREDLKTIFSAPLARPDRIVYFCEPDVPVGKRHQLQIECREEYGAALDIYDGNWIAGELTALDTFYLAERFLSVSADFSPAEPFDERYDAQRVKWIVESEEPSSFGDFLEIRDGLRTAARNDSAGQDLDQWLVLMRRFAKLAEPVWLVQRARYEVCLAEFRGHHSLVNADELWRDYFTSISDTPEAKELSDAVVLVIHAFEASRQSQTTLSPAELQEQAERIDSLCKIALDGHIGNQEAPLVLEARAMLVPVLIKGSQSKIYRAMLDAWEHVINAAKNTPFYPTTRLGEVFMRLNEDLGGDEHFRDLSVQVDELVSEREGAADRADRARTRALQDLKKGRRIAALSEFHHVRMGWFNDENIDGSILSMLIISEIYDDLNLHLAARYYAAGALYIAMKHPSDKVNRLISFAAFRLAKTFYAAGEGLSYLYALGYALELHNRTSAEPYNWENHEHVQTAFAQAAILRGITLVLAPEILPLVDTALAKWSIDSDELHKFKMMSEGDPWGTMSRAEIEAKIAESIGSSPYADLGPQRAIKWAALGIIWVIQFKDDGTRRRAIELAVTLQIVQAELGAIDLVLLPSTITVDVTVGFAKSPLVTQSPSNDVGVWSVDMPFEPAESFEKSTLNAVAVCVAILRSYSVLPAAAFDSAIDRFMEKDLIGRVASVRPIDELVSLFDPPEIGREYLDTLQPFELEAQCTPLEDPELAWRGGPGPNYSLGRAQKSLEKRYARFAPSIALTLLRVVADQRCRAIVQQMRDDGMLDWQILQAIASLVIPWQVERRFGRPKTTDEMVEFKRRCDERGQSPDSGDYPEFDLSLVTTDSLRMRSRFGRVAVLKAWGMENRQRTPDLGAIKKLLDARYRNNVDDVPHTDPFA